MRACKGKIGRVKTIISTLAVAVEQVTKTHTTEFWQLGTRDDNYVYFVVTPETGEVSVIDPSDGAPVLETCEVTPRVCGAHISFWVGVYPCLCVSVSLRFCVTRSLSMSNSLSLYLSVLLVTLQQFRFHTRSDPKGKGVEHHSDNKHALAPRSYGRQLGRESRARGDCGWAGKSTSPIMIIIETRTLKCIKFNLHLHLNVLSLSLSRWCLAGCCTLC